MAKAKAMFDAGQLGPAIEELTREVKSSPNEIWQRIFLFEMLCFAGDFDRAERQLDVIRHQSVQAEIGVQIYRNNIRAERDRTRLFADGLQPHFLMEPPAYIDLLLDAVNRMREGDLIEASQLLTRAEEERPALAGKLNGRQFFDLRDYDDVVGPVVELLVHDKYTWLPFEQVKRIEISAPKVLRDLLWAPARLEWREGVMGEVFIPTLYAGSSEHSNDQVKLGRMTDWKKIGEEVFLAAGLRLFLVDEKDAPVLDVRTIEFDPVIIGGRTPPS